MRTHPRRSARRLVLAATLVALGAACADDDSPPGEPTITLYQETVLRDPTPTTAP